MKPETISGSIAGGWMREEHDQPLVATRRAALERLSAILSHGMPGPVLITGEPGAGKTWLVDRLLKELVPASVAVPITLTRAVLPQELLAMIAVSLGASPEDTTTLLPRWQIARLLRSELADQRRTVLVIDQPQRASAQVWEEIDVLIDQIGRPGGFSALIVTAHTELVGMLTGRTTRSLVASLSAHVHLPPLDLDEVDELLAPQHHLVDDGHLYQELLRESRGNPRRLLRLAEQKTLSLRADRGDRLTESLHAFARVAAHTERDSPDAGWDFVAQPLLDEEYPVVEPSLRPMDSDGSTPTPDLFDHDTHRDEDRRHYSSSPEFGAASQPQALLPVRPPLRVEDGLVEVGWDGNVETESGDDRPLSSGDRPTAPAALVPISDAGPTGAGLDSHVWESEDEHRLEDETDREVTGRSPLIRVESAREFPPYSHLFSRLRQTNQD
jgi:type II secretory pathway predicted ATPase ExeA